MLCDSDMIMVKQLYKDVKIKKFQKNVNRKTRLAVASWSFILCALFVILVVQDSSKFCERCSSETSTRWFKQLPTDGQLLSNITLAEDLDVKLSNSHIKEGNDDDDHKKIKWKQVKKHDDDDENHNHMDPELNVFFIPSDLKFSIAIANLALLVHLRFYYKVRMEDEFKLQLFATWTPLSGTQNTCHFVYSRLNQEPPVCHFFPSDKLVLAPLPATDF
ncbi:hypothetical protein L6164_031930 [Bauhinia variegata]|uniref:Uncharacterized protein n=1 Tax=Bauhinia variegata TaxID=167791 RepID=A0ACB9KLZ2_BAUVA|nr:hypothetical protein L6164_031930 [Bauhinia variegata]